MLSEHINTPPQELIAEAVTRLSALPPHLFLGALSWTFRGWTPFVYKREYSSEAEFLRESLAEYAAFPLFRAAGIDSSFYRPLSIKNATLYRSQVPESFRFVTKCWQQITRPFTLDARGAPVEENPHFLNWESFEQAVLPALVALGPTLGGVVLQFGRLPLGGAGAARFLDGLEQFLMAARGAFPIACEVRNRELLIPQYFELLNRTGATHCFNSWEDMASLREQMKAAASAGGVQAQWVLSRALTHPGQSYESAKEAYAPFAKLQAVDPAVRRDLLNIARRGTERAVPTFILINNKAEGSAPLTVASLILQLTERNGTAEQG